MRILLVNNAVRQGSGIDAFVAVEKRLLTARGHDVVVFERDNHEYDRAAPSRRAALLASSLYSLPVRRDLSRLLARERVDVAHLHNLVPFVTGAAYDACRVHGIPTVQHLHNYRAFCLSSWDFRDERGATTACEDGVRSVCRPSLLPRLPTGERGLAAARWIDWSRGRRSGYAADLYIANSRHTADVHAAHGLPQERIEVLHNPADDLAALLPAAEPQERPDVHGGRPKLTFVGSLIRTKGPSVALDLAAALPDFDVHLIGTGDEESVLRDAARRRRLRNVTFHGLLRDRDKAATWAGGFLTVVPSLWDEPFGLVVPESYSLGVPVLATVAGGLAETVADGETGLRLDPHDVEGAAARVRELWRDDGRYRRMRAAARAAYEARFTESVFAPRLEDLLRRAAGACS